MPGWRNDENPEEPIDPEFMEVLMGQLPDSVRQKFQDPEEAQMYLRRIDRALRTVGLVLEDGALGLDPMQGVAVIKLTARVDPNEDAYQQERELRSMLYDAEQDAVKRGLADLQKEYGSRTDEEEDTG
jgi:hypothetical protein